MADNIQINPRLTKSVKEVLDIKSINEVLNDLLVQAELPTVDLSGTVNIMFDDELLRQFLVEVERRLRQTESSLSDIPALLNSIDLSGVNLNDRTETVLGVSNNQSLDSTSYTSLSLNVQKILDSETFKHDVAFESNKVTVLKAGTYKISGFVLVESTTTNYNAVFQSAVTKNEEDIDNDVSGIAISGNIVSVPFNKVLVCNSNDVLEFKIKRTTATTGDGQTVIGGTELILERLHV